LLSQDSAQVLNLLQEFLILFFQLAVLLNQAVDELQRVCSILARAGGRILYNVRLGTHPFDRAYAHENQAEGPMQSTPRKHLG
jgi:hypothetical protein